jgi:23S rRNA (guanosine2251-2'-O)-methyltransferase
MGKHVSIDASRLRKKEYVKYTDLDVIMQNYDRVILLDNLTDQRNIGSIIRTAAICGFAVLLREKSTINEFTIKCASGGTENTDICSVKNIQETLTKLKKNGFWIIGLSENGELSQPNGFNKIVLVIGSEGDGISSLVKANCDLLWKLKGGEFNVYNASNASAIAMYLQSNL